MNGTYGHDDVIAVLTRDHREVQALFEELDETRDSLDPRQRKAQTDRVTVELIRHSTVEEQFLYPVVRVTVAGGAELADREVREHVQLERSLKELELMPAGNAAFEPTLRHLNEMVMEHIAGQEQTLFPRLRAMCSAEDLVEVGELVTADKHAAPARQQPGVHDIYGVDVLCDRDLRGGVDGAHAASFSEPAAHHPGLVDRIRDAFNAHGYGPRA